MNLFKNFSTGILIRFVLILIFISGNTYLVNAQEMKSDYQIQQNFKEEYKSLNNQVDTVRSLAAVNQLIEQIKEFEETYDKHSDLLNKVLYPESFSNQLDQLKFRAVATKERLATIHEKNQKLDQLTEKLSGYESQLDRLDRRTDSLRTAISKSVQSEKELSSLVRRYRNSLEQRDELIISIVDSVLISYQNLKIESLENFEETTEQARLSTDGNVLKMVETIAGQNIEFLNTNPNVATADLLRMKAVQQKFEEMWDTVGDKLVKIYAEGNEQEARTGVEDAIGVWSEKITTQTWSSISSSFAEAGIELGKFENRQAFYDTLEAYIDNAITESEGGSASHYREYQKFSSFWNSNVQVSWSPYLTEAGVLTSQQLASIDQKLNKWAATAKPESNLMVYLLGASILAIVILGVLLFREKGSNPAEKASKTKQTEPTK